MLDVLGCPTRPEVAFLAKGLGWGNKKRCKEQEVVVAAAGERSSPPQVTNSAVKWFNGFGCGIGAFAFGVGYGAIVGGGVGYGPGMPYARPTFFFGVGFGSFVGVGVGVGRMLGVNFRSPSIDWEEVVLGQKSWGVSSKKKKQQALPST